MSHDFISYSRYNVTFADSLFHHLKQSGRNPWLDFRRLVPGQPWEKQIFQAVETAGIMLLIVSPQSLSSKNVKDEWTAALALGKRIVLLIYEAARLPAELTSCEWVDFRGRFDTALRTLLGILNSPYTPCQTRPPQSGFKIPPLPRLLSAGMAFVVINGVLGLEYPLILIREVLLGTETRIITPLDWAGFLFVYAIPLVIIVRLVQAPFKIARRTYRFHDIETALLVAMFLQPLMVPGLFLSFGLLLQLFAGLQVEQPELVFTALVWIYGRAGFAFVMAAVCWCVLRFSEAMYRWAGSEGVHKVHREEEIDNKDQLPRQTTHVQVIYAKEDSAIGDEIVLECRKYGHQVDVSYADDFQLSDAPIILLLISRYNPITISDTDQQTIIPLILESVDIPDELARRQWIDLRRGLPLEMTKTLARLLVYPDVLVEHVGVIPTKLATLRPVNVNALITALHLTIGFHVLWLVGAFLTGMAGYALSGPGCYFAGHLVVILLALHSLKMLLNRRGNQLHILRNAVLILMLSWLLHLCGGQFIDIPNEIYMRPDGKIAGTAAISTISSRGIEGFFLGQVMPLIVLLFSFGPGIGNWLPKSRLEMQTDSLSTEPVQQQG